MDGDEVGLYYPARGRGQSYGLPVTVVPGLPF